MKLMTLLLLAAFIMTTLTSCGNPHVTEELDKITTGNDDLNPNPDEPNDPPDPDPADPRDIVLKIVPRGVGKGEYKHLQLPYRTMFFKVFKPGESKKNLLCKNKFKKKCVINKQVLFAIDTDVFKEYRNNFQLKYLKIKADFYSYKKNRRSEMICFVNDQVCSGRAIAKIPGIGLPDLAKLVAWNGKFWMRGPEGVVRNEIFHEFLKAGWSEEDEVYIQKNAVFTASRLFDQVPGRFQEHVFNDTPLYFSVTDDTYVENLEVEVYLREVIPN